MTFPTFRRLTPLAMGLVVLGAAWSIAPAAEAQTNTQGQPAADDQETFTKEHLALAQQAIDASKSATGFDNILPVVADQTRTLFIRSNPALTPQIEEVTQEVAIGLAPKRRALDETLEKIWARRFSEDELRQIVAFYNSPVGKKLSDLSAEILALSVGAAKQWGDQISTEMVTRVREQMLKRGYKL